MDEKTLRVKILRLVSEHEATGSAHYLSDKEIAAALGIDEQDVQRQLLILGDSLGLLKLAKTTAPNYAAALTANGMLWLAQEHDTERDGPQRQR